MADHNSNNNNNNNNNDNNNINIDIDIINDNIQNERSLAEIVLEPGLGSNMHCCSALICIAGSASMFILAIIPLTRGYETLLVAIGVVAAALADFCWHDEITWPVQNMRPTLLTVIGASVVAIDRAFDSRSGWAVVTVWAAILALSAIIMALSAIIITGYNRKKFREDAFAIGSKVSFGLLFWLVTHWLSPHC
jgi:hypothetical protein